MPESDNSGQVRYLYKSIKYIKLLFFLLLTALQLFNNICGIIIINVIYIDQFSNSTLIMIIPQIFRLLNDCIVFSGTLKLQLINSSLQVS